MMDTHVKYTHELKYYGSKIYKGDKRIKHEFENIDTVEPVIWTNGKKYIKVTGTLHLYGYKVENGGFFDIINVKYYPEYHDYVKNGEISEARCNYIQTKLIRKK